MKKYKEGTNYLVSGATFNEISNGINWVNENKFRLSDTPHASKSYQNGEIRVKLTGKESLPLFSAVTLGNLTVVGSTYTVPTFNVHAATSGDAEDAPFAICVEPAKKNILTKAILTGVVQAPVTVTNKDHQYARPKRNGSGYLESCENGTARIIYKSGETGDLLTVLQLGGGGGGKSVTVEKKYNGMFLATKITTTGESGKEIPMIKVINGGSPNSANCGITDVGAVPVSTIDFQYEKTLYLIAQYNDEASFSFSFSFDLPASSLSAAWYAIAETSINGNINQLWQDGVIYFSERYIV